MVPVLTIDGPSGSGKGTIARRMAQHLGWHLLDSGALYRLTALAAQERGIVLDDEAAVAALAAKLPVAFEVDGDAELILLNGADVTSRVRQESTGTLASRVASLPAVRAALIDLQHSFWRAPGLVADGRDMGTDIFPDAAAKVFLTASAEERARRRVVQLQQMGVDAKIDRILSEITARDARDASRPVSPLRPADDAVTVDTTGRGVDEVLAQVIDLAREKMG